MLKSSKLLKISVLVLACLIISVVTVRKLNKYQSRLAEYKNELATYQDEIAECKTNYQMLLKRVTPTFTLSNVKGEIVSNKNYEFPEQGLLYEFLDKDDIVLQLGGNIGTSCIFADKILDKKDKQLCVEPNNELMDVLQKNKKLNNAHFNIINGIVSNKVCSYKKNPADENLVGVSFTALPNNYRHQEEGMI
jgi:hypothetical protein